MSDGGWLLTLLAVAAAWTLFCVASMVAMENDRLNERHRKEKPNE